MNALARVLRVRLGSEPLDAWLSRWGCILGGLAVSGFAVVALQRHATTRTEFLLGAMATFVTCSLLFLLGALARQVHLAIRDGKAPWRSRHWELMAHGAGLAVAGFSGWALAGAAPGVASMVTGAVLILGAYSAIICLGCWATLASSLRRSDGAGPGR